MTQGSGELTREERDFYKEIAKELIKTSIPSLESNAARILTVLTLIATLYAAIVGFWVTSEIKLSPVGSLILAVPEMLLIVSVIFVAQALVPKRLKVNVLSPDLTYESYNDIVKYKSSRIKRSFEILIIALISIFAIMMALTMIRTFFIVS